MAYAEHHDYHNDMGAGRATGGAIGIYAAMGIGLGILAAIAAYGLRGITTVDATDVTAGIGALLIGSFPFLAAPILAIIVGTWAGQATKSAGSGSLAGALGALIGTIVMFLLIAIGFLIGAAIAGIDLGAITWPQNVNIAPSIANLAGYLLSLSGILYLATNMIMAAVAGAIVGAMARPVVVAERRQVTRGNPRV